MTCAVCREPVTIDGPLGYVHEDGRKVAEDGHEAVGVNLGE